MKQALDTRTKLLTKNPWPLMIELSIPAVLGMVVVGLYNMMDSIFVGQMVGDVQMGAISVSYPLTLINAGSAAMLGVGSASVLSRAIGKKDENTIKKIMGNLVAMVLLLSVIYTVVGMVFTRQLLSLTGASDNILNYAEKYLRIVFAGSLFVNFFQSANMVIRGEGQLKKAMTIIASGAILNIILDPIFIFVLHMGIRGAALATILSQLLSAIWILRFLTSDKTILKLRRSSMRLSAQRVRKIVGLGLSGFTMSITNCTVQIMCNATLQVYGGDLYVGVMTVINSIREIATLPVTGVTHSAQPVLGFNYGAKEYGRVKKAIVFTSFIAILYTTGIWLIVDGFPAFFIRIFNQDAELIAAGIPAIRLYFFGFFMMSLQFSGQSIFVGLGKSKKAIFFSIFRKVIIVVPLTILLPGMFGMGTNGVFAAEPISNFVGGIACFGTMLLTIWRELTRLQKGKDSYR